MLYCYISIGYTCNCCSRTLFRTNLLLALSLSGNLLQSLLTLHDSPTKFTRLLVAELESLDQFRHLLLGQKELIW